MEQQEIFRHASMIHPPVLEHVVRVLLYALVYTLIVVVAEQLAGVLDRQGLLADIARDYITGIILFSIFEYQLSKIHTVIDFGKREVRGRSSLFGQTVSLPIDEIESVTICKPWFYWGNVKVRTANGKTTKLSIDDADRFATLLKDANTNIQVP